MFFFLVFQLHREAFMFSRLQKLNILQKKKKLICDLLIVFFFSAHLIKLQVVYLCADSLSKTKAQFQTYRQCLKDERIEIRNEESLQFQV